MPTNDVILSPGVGGAVINTEGFEDGTQMPRSKIVTGGFGTDGGDVGQDNPLYTAVVPGGIVSNTYNVVTLVSANIETTVASYTVPSGSFQCVGFSAQGDVGTSYYRLYIDGSAQLSARSSVAFPSASASFQAATPAVAAGETIRLSVVHYASGIQGNFDGTILGIQS